MKIRKGQDADAALAARAKVATAARKQSSARILEFVPPDHGASTRLDVVRTLEEFLERAKTGEITGLALVASTKIGTTLTIETECEDLHLLVSGLARLQHRIIRRSEKS